MTKRKIHVMNSFVSFMNIHDHSQREAQNHLWTFMASLMIIYDPKKREAQKNEDHLCFIDDYFWQKQNIKG